MRHAIAVRDSGGVQEEQIAARVLERKRDRLVDFEEQPVEIGDMQFLRADNESIAPCWKRLDVDGGGGVKRRIGAGRA